MKVLGNSCIVDGGNCPNISWSFVEDDERGNVLQVQHGSGFAGLFFGIRNQVSPITSMVCLASTSKSWPRCQYAGFVMKADCVTLAARVIRRSAPLAWMVGKRSSFRSLTSCSAVESETGLVVIFPVAGQTDGWCIVWITLNGKRRPAVRAVRLPARGAAPEEGALKMSSEEFSGAWWQLGEADVVTRACLMDDVHVFNADGSFENRLARRPGWNHGRAMRVAVHRLSHMMDQCPPLGTMTPMQG